MPFPSALASSILERSTRCACSVLVLDIFSSFSLSPSASVKVDAVLATAVAAGGAIARAGAPTSWGGYSGVFLDPDGHPWEVAHNPGFPLDEDGSVRLPE